MKVLDASHKEIELRDLDDDDDVVNVDALSKLAQKKDQEAKDKKAAADQEETKSTNVNNSND
ncbi:hypothetical protein HMPREF9104_00619 [Lentilactobacillus kisonensis F0435]|uniref:Uncharacterized protein n=2 Tax=Lentilactobacillus kisonensis TaxID=481722 RepID=H1LDF5_9LACO|nr:hypothetical protein HMPREF9104_00619 [Lentilactobacillus kisonensis F0435]